MTPNYDRQKCGIILVIAQVQIGQNSNFELSCASCKCKAIYTLGNSNKTMKILALIDYFYCGQYILTKN